MHLGLICLLDAILHVAVPQKKDNLFLIESQNLNTRIELSPSRRHRTRSVPGDTTRYGLVAGEVVCAYADL